MNKLHSIIAIAFIAFGATSCSKDQEPTIIIPPAEGSTLILNGIAGTEDGASAANSVYVDFSEGKQTAVLRDSWDLGFYCGSDYKVILNGSIFASALKVDKTDLNSVSADDFDANLLKVGQGSGVLTATNTVPVVIDDPRESNILNKTAIATISATDADNKVYIINRKGGSVLPAEDLYKVRILRNGTTGYTIQYAKVTASTYATIDVTKDSEANFKFVSLVQGKTVNVEPGKSNWDIVWGYNTYYTATFPYAFSDFVLVNNIGGISSAQILTSNKAYADFVEADLSTVTFSTNRDLIGSTWRTTSGGALGVKTDRFYLIKDNAGNVYKLKFNSFISNDGGERGKPVIEYKLVKKG